LQRNSWSWKLTGGKDTARFQKNADAGIQKKQGGEAFYPQPATKSKSGKLTKKLQSLGGGRLRRT